MSKSKNRQSAVSLILAIVVSLFVFPHSAHGQAFPSRAFEIKNGSVEMQGGLLGFRDEVMLWMALANKTEQTVWAEVAFRLPGSGERLRGFKKIRKKGSQMYRWPLPKIAWDTEYPFTVAVFKDKKRKRPLGREESFFFFESGKSREAFEDLRRKLPPGRATAFNGFRELTGPSLSAEVPGTAASSQLQADITRRLFTEESKLHKECAHVVLKAELYAKSDRSLITAEMGKKAQELEERLRAKGDMLVEKWFVKSCNVTSTYEVLLTRSVAGGTDILVKKIAEAVKK